MRSQKSLRAKKNMVKLRHRRRYNKKLVKKQIKNSAQQWFLINTLELYHKKEQELKAMGID